MQQPGFDSWIAHDGVGLVYDRFQRRVVDVRERPEALEELARTRALVVCYDPGMEDESHFWAEWSLRLAITCAQGVSLEDKAYALESVGAANLGQGAQPLFDASNAHDRLWCIVQLYLAVQERGWIQSPTGPGGIRIGDPMKPDTVEEAADW